MPIVRVNGISCVGPNAERFHEAAAAALDTYPAALLYRAGVALSDDIQHLTDTEGLMSIWQGPIPERVAQLSEGEEMATHFKFVWRQANEIGRPQQVIVLFSRDDDDQGGGLSPLQTIAVCSSLPDDILPAVMVVTGEGAALVRESLTSWYQRVSQALGPVPARRLTINQVLHYLGMVSRKLAGNFSAPAVRATWPVLGLASKRHGAKVLGDMRLGVWGGKLYLLPDTEQSIARLYLPKPPEFYAPVLATGGQG